MPTPCVNQLIDLGDRRAEVDFCWPTLSVVVEIDGYAFHGGRRRANSDRDRDQRLAMAGWKVYRFTADQLRNEPQLVIHRLRTLLTAARTG